MIFLGVVLDNIQTKLVSILDNIITRVNSKSRLEKLIFRIGLSFSFFVIFLRKIGVLCKIHNNHNKYSNNIYIYGSVGRGKTMIAKAFFCDLPEPKLFTHYQDLMLNLHESVHKMKGMATHDVLVKLAKNMAKKYTYICVDEFEVNDIADAMIISRFFSEMMRCGVNFCITSNTKPSELYKYGLQREQFLHFIRTIHEEFIEFALDTQHDYRLDSIESIDDRVIYPLTQDVIAKMKVIKKHLTDGGNYTPHTLEVFKRPLILPFTYKTVLVTDFNTLCKKQLSSNDFIAICKYFTAIVLENVPLIGEDETDVIIRFINLIDSIYFHKVLLFISLEASPEEIYIKGKRVKEFQRTVSRLYEINSDAYLTLSKHK